MERTATSLLFAICIVLLLAGNCLAGGNANRTLSKYVIFEGDKDSISAILFDRDKRFAAVVQRVGDKFRLRREGFTSKEMDRVGDVLVSGSKFFYTAFINGEWYLYENNKLLGIFSDYKEGTLVSFAGSTGIIVKSDDKWCIISYSNKGELSKGELYQDIKSGRENLIIAENDRNLSYIVKQNNKWAVIYYVKPYRWFDDVSSVVISNDGKAFAYVVQAGTQKKLAYIGIYKKTYHYDQRYDDMTKPVFCPDNMRILFGAKLSNKWSLMQFGEKTFEDNGEELIKVNGPNGKVNMEIANPHGASILLDYPISEPYDEMQQPVMSQDGRNIAYPARKGKNWYMVLNGTISNPYDDVSDPVFSRDGLHLVYKAKVKEGWTLVYDNYSSMIFNDVKFPLFSPSGKHLAYAAKTKMGWCVVIDGQEGEYFSDILSEKLWFSSEFSVEKNAMGTFTSPTGVQYIALDAKGNKAILYRITDSLQ
ncbi:MAG: TolB family protein [Armatimonadota bacterium]